MTVKKGIKSSHLFYEITKQSVYCYDCKGVRAKDSTLHSRKEQTALEKWEERISHYQDE